MLSQKFITTIKLHKLPAYEIAHQAGIHPSTLSKLINGIEKVTICDQRVVAIANVLGLKPEDCFKGK